jgi:hypothetical protein
VKEVLSHPLFLIEVFYLNQILSPVVAQQRKPTNNNSGDDGERNPPQGSLENPHKLKVKRKRINSQQGGEKKTYLKMISCLMIWI